MENNWQNRKLKEMKLEEVPDEFVGNCIKRIIRDGFKLSKFKLKQALETFYDIKLID